MNASVQSATGSPQPTAVTGRDSRASVPWMPVVGALIRRSWSALLRIPATLIPVIVMPIFFAVAFSGAFRGVTLIGSFGGGPRFPTSNIYNWMIPYACLNTASFTGLSASFSLGRDLETGFYDRLLLAPAPQWSIAASSVIYSAARAVLPLGITLTVGTLGGMTFPGGPMAVVWLAIAAIGVSALGALWGMGVTYRLKTQSAGGLVQIGNFVAMFLSVGTTPVNIQRGWLPHVARWNPMTPIMGLARAGFIEPVNTWSVVWPGLVAIVVSMALLGWFAARGFARVTP